MPSEAWSITHRSGLAQRSRATIAHSLPDAALLAKNSLARDIDESSDNDDTASSISTSDSETSTLRPSRSAPTPPHGFAGHYRRSSFAGAGNRTILFSAAADTDRLTEAERDRMIEEERSLLRDNKLIPPKHAHGEQRRRMSIIPFATDGATSSDRMENTTATNEVTPLLAEHPNEPYGGQNSPKKIQQKWDEAIAHKKIHTTWQREAKVIAKYSLPLMLTFLLQYSLTVASIFTVGHIGTAELGAVSLASMTANITGYAVYQGLATSLDTLCAQAYGSGRKKLVGLQMQRMVYFLWVLTVPIGLVWLCADRILQLIVPEREVAHLAGLYLKVVLVGAPGYATFQAGTRYVQAQGLFSATMYVLLFCAPLNAFMHWLFVWKLGFGFIGAPAAVAITDTLLPIGLFVYVKFFSKSGMSCWNGFTRKALTNWTPMIKLALPGLVMVEAEMIAFEILTFAASLFGTTTLAAQSVLATLTSITYQIPFPLSIAGSTRVANLIGATLSDAARVSTRVTFAAAVVIGLLNVTLLSALKDHIPWLFTSDAQVASIVSRILPLCAAFQLFDALAANCNGILRGLGRQEFGGYVQLFCYYVIAMPLSFGTAFGLHWGLWGLWTGVALALGVVAAIEFVYLYGVLDWEKCVEDATRRSLTDA